jgi:hypothetical protein
LLTDLFAGRLFCGPAIIKSIAGSGRQATHTDFFNGMSIDELKEEDNDCLNHDVPLVAFGALEEETKMIICEKGKQEMLILGAGDLLIMSGFLAHGGAAYDKENKRLFLSAHSAKHISGPTSQNFTAFEIPEGAAKKGSAKKVCAKKGR